MTEPDFVYNFELPFNMMLAGHTGSGKTFLLVRIMKQLWTRFTYVMIMSRTMGLNTDYDEFPENDNVNLLPLVKHFDDNFVQYTKTVIEEQDKLIKEDREEAPEILIVFEDQANTELTQFRGMLDSFALLSRHYKISMILSTQRITAIGKTIRLNVKYFILFPTSNFSELERFLEESVATKYRKLIRDHIDEIFVKKFQYILVDSQNPVMKDRMWLNGTVNVIEFISNLEKNDEPAAKRAKPSPSLTNIIFDQPLK